jgi:hypothetical protein
MVEGEGFEPSKAAPTDLQSAPFGHSGTPPLELKRTDNRNYTTGFIICQDGTDWFLNSGLARFHRCSSAFVSIRPVFPNTALIYVSHAVTRYQWI